MRFFRSLKYRNNGTVFIEYVPAEYAWKPVDAPGYLLINCLWVSGRYKQQGHGRQLMEEAIRDAARKGRIEDADGVVIMYSHQCPFHEEYAGIMVDTARALGIPARSVRIESLQEAREVPYPAGLVGVYLNGESITKKFGKNLLDRVNTRVNPAFVYHNV